MIVYALVSSQTIENHVLEKEKMMKTIKHLSLLALFAGLLFSHEALATSTGTTPPLDEDSKEKKKPVGQKIARESARVVGQVEVEAKNLKKGWKEQRKKDKEKKKQKKEKKKREKQ